MNPADLPPDPFDGRAELQRALVLAMAQARHQMLWFDRDLSDWPLEQPAVARLLARFCASRGARLRVLVRDGDWIEQRAARFAALRRRAAGAIECRLLAPGALRADEGVLLADGAHLVRRFHSDHWRGRISLDDPASVQAIAPRYEALWEAGAPFAAPTTLGL